MKKYNAAFTLIEIIIVVAIMVTLTGFITANYVQYSEERKLNEALINLKTVLNLARTKAATGDIGTYPCGDFQGYQVKFDSATKAYTLKLCCSTGCSSTAYTIGTYTLKTNVSVRTPAFDIIFLPFARGLYSNAATAIELRNSSIKQCNYLKVSAIGVIDQGTPYTC